MANSTSLVSALTAILAAGSISCGSVAPSTNPTAQDHLRATGGSLEGTWTLPSGCGTDTAHPADQISGKLSITFSRGNSVYSVLTTYSDRACKTPYATEEFFGSYTVTSGNPAVKEPGAMAIDFTLNKETFTPLAQSFVDQCGSDHDQCGSCVTGLKLGIQKIIYPPDSCMKEDWIGQSPFRAFKLMGNQLLISTDEHSGESDEYRMVGFSEAAKLVRQPR